jgi:hypothetical protein
MFEYINNYYQVKAALARTVTVDGRRGIIVADRGHYLGVCFDDDKPNLTSNVHPTWKVTYGEIGVIRKVTRSQRRYQRFLEYGDCFDNFIAFCYWDAEQTRLSRQ